MALRLTSLAVLASIGLWSFLGVEARPQGITAAPICTTTTLTYGIATTVTDYDAFISSLNSVFSTATASFTELEVPVHTTAFDFPGLGYITAYGFYDASALREAGFTVTSGLTTISGPCPTATLPPSPTGSLCEAHGDHCKLSIANLASQFTNN